MNAVKHRIVSVIFLFTLAIVLIFCRHAENFPLLLVSILLLFIAIIAYGSYQIKANYFIDSVNKGNADAICFTFDDGPDEEITPKILELLEAENLKAAFFMIGNKIEKHPELVKEIYKKGHVVANHSYSHSNKIALFSTEELMNDIAKCSAAIEKTIGEKTTLFRPPFGVTTPRYARVLKKLRLKSIGWTIRSFDTVEKSKEKLVAKIIRSIKPGAIILFHDTKRITLDALPAIILHCKKNGIKIAPLHELIGTSL